MWEGSWGLVGWVAILKMAAMASYSAQGGFSVSISTTVQPRLLEKQMGKKKEVRTDSYSNAQCSETTSKQPTSRYSSALKTAIKWLCAQRMPCVHGFWARSANAAAFTTVRLPVKCWDREAGFHCGSHCAERTVKCHLPSSPLLKFYSQ